MLDPERPVVSPAGEETLPVQAPRTIFKQGLVLLEDRLAPLEASGSARMIEALRKTPAVEVPYNDRWELLRRLWQLPSGPEMNVPENLRAEEVRLPPQGRLMIDKPERYDPYRLPGRVDFLYDGKSVSAQETARGIVDEEKGRILVRDRQRERELAAVAGARGIRPMEGWQAEKYSIWIPSQKLPEAVEALVAEGWIVEAQGYFVRRAGTWRMNVTSGVDWFDLAGTLDFDGMEVHLPEILEALRHGQNYVRLKDGSRGLLPQEWLERFASMAELGEAEGEAIRFRSSQALLLDALLAAQEQVTVDAPFAKLRENLRSFNGVGPVDEPAGFSGELRPYQKTGLGWLHFLQDFRLGGCLADDMGLGKTVQVLAMLQERRSRPADADGRRAAFAGRGAQEPRLQLDRGGQAVHARVAGVGLHRPAARPLGRQLRSIRPGDHHLRHHAARHRQAQGPPLRLRHPGRVAGDQERPLAAGQGQPAAEGRSPPGHDRHARWRTTWASSGRCWSSSTRACSARRRCFRTSRRRSPRTTRGCRCSAARWGRSFSAAPSSRCLTELPQKTEQTLHCDLEGKQRKRYDELRTYYRAVLTERIAKTGMAKAKIHVLEALLRLRQAAIHPGLIDKDAVDESSAKLDVLMEQLREIIDEGHKALVFSQFTSFLAIVRNRLDQEKLVYEYLDGRTRQRQQHVERFQNDPDCPLFLISLKAGGHGLEPHGGRLRVHSRPLVEPGRRGPGHRPGPSHRPGAARVRLSPDRAGHGRGEDRRAAENETRPGRRDHLGRRQRLEPADERRSGIAVELKALERTIASLCNFSLTKKKPIVGDWYDHPEYYDLSLQRRNAPGGGVHRSGLPQILRFSRSPAAGAGLRLGTAGGRNGRPRLPRDGPGSEREGIGLPAKTVEEAKARAPRSCGPT